MRQASDDGNRRPLDSIVFGSNDIGTSTLSAVGRTTSNASVSYSGYNSSAASRSGSLPPSRHGLDQPSQFGFDHTSSLQPVQVGTTDGFPHRPNQSSRTSTYSANGNIKFSDHNTSLQYDDLPSTFGKMDLKENQDSLYSYDYYPQQTALAGSNGNYTANVSGLRNGSISFETDNRPGSSLAPPYPQYRQQLGDRGSYSPGSNDLRRSHDSPLYSTSGTPPLADHHRRPSNASVQRSNASGGQAALLERKLRGLQQEQQGYQGAQRNPLQYQNPYGQGYDYNSANMLRMNPLAPYYAMPSTQTYQTNAQNYAVNRSIPQIPTTESNTGESLRSTLLEEFRSNNKGTKRYELKVGCLT